MVIKFVKNSAKFEIKNDLYADNTCHTFLCNHFAELK